MADQSTNQATGACCEELIHENLELVQHVVNQVSVSFPRHVDRQELWNAGALGLVEAAKRYRPESGVPFARYASVRIRGAVIDCTRDRDWVARSTRRRLRELREAESRLEIEQGRTPDDAEVASALGIDDAELRSRRVAESASALLHLDQEFEEDGTLAATIEERNPVYLPEERLCDAELIGTIRTAVAHLPEAQREVVVRYYFEGEMLRDIAASMNVTAARVSQICSEAIHAIRTYLVALGEQCPPAPADAPGKRGRVQYVAQLSAQTTWRSRLEASEGPLTTRIA